MRFSKSILISGITTLVGVKADGWSSSAAPVSTLWYTQVITETLPASTVSIPYTVTSTVDIYETTTITVTTISISVVTSNVITTVNQPTTITVISDFTTTIVQPTTITDFITQPTTITDFITQPTTVVSPVTTTVEQPTTVTLIDSITVTSTPLTGIVTCPSRTINPTYTAQTPFPDEYTWGCPPGTVCTPPKINCNFEQNPPADTYYCSPDECSSVGSLPDLTSLEASAGTTCGPFPTISTEPFNFNPSLFGLGFTIFECGGDWAESCSGGSTVTTTTTATELETVILTPATTTETELETVILTPATTTATEIETVTITPATSTQYWSSEGPNATWGRLEKRAQQLLPAKCYQPCDNCLEIACNNGKPANCPGNSPFSVAYSDCNACIGAHLGGSVVVDQVLPSISQFITYCSDNPGATKKKRDEVQSTLVMASPTPKSQITATPPATTAKASLTRRRPRYAIN
jgi:hypothetical protein